MTVECIRCRALIESWGWKPDYELATDEMKCLKSIHNRWHGDDE